MWDYIEEKVLSHFKSKENFSGLVTKTKESFTQLINNIKEKIRSLLRREKEESEATKTTYGRYTEILKKYGIDVNELKVSANA